LLSDGAKVRVAGRQFAEGVANTDDRPAVKLVMRYALALDPAAVGKSIAVLPAEPLLAAQFFGAFFGGRGGFGVGHWGKSLKRETYYRHMIEFIYKLLLVFCFFAFFATQAAVEIQD
jgi:hypothetical protein